MPKILSRYVAVAIAVCLTVDPAFAGSFAPISLDQNRALNLLPCFTAEALSVRSDMFTRPALYRHGAAWMDRIAEVALRAQYYAKFVFLNGGGFGFLIGIGGGIGQPARRTIALTSDTFRALVNKTSRDLLQGKLPPIVLGYNIKTFTPEAEDLYTHSDGRLLLLKSKVGKVQIIRREERTDERKHDLPGAAGVLEKIMEVAGNGQWRDSTVVIITDGGQKTRAGNKTLSDVYAGLWRLPGKRYDNLREAGFINSLAIMRLLPDGLKRFVGWSASDNFVFLGRASIGGKSLLDANAMKEKLEDASIVKGGARIALLNEQDMEYLSHIHGSFTIESIIKALGTSRWDEIRGIITQEKLTDLGMLAVDENGLMTAFLEKEKDVARLINLFYFHGGVLYKNPFLEFPDKRFLEKLLTYLKATVSENADIGTLDMLPVSYMQTAYQSRFESFDSWMSLRPKKIGAKDWFELKRISDDIFAQEKTEGRGSIYVFDFGEGFQWVDVGNLDDWARFLDQVIQDNEIRQLLDMPQHVNRDEATVHIESSVKTVISDQAYVERTVVTGGGTLQIDEGAYLGDVNIHIPVGKILHVKRGAKIIESELDLSHMDFRVDSGALVERVFLDQLPLSMGAEGLIARTNERMTMLQVDGKHYVSRNLINVPYKEVKMGTIAPDVDAWEKLVRDHPEYLRQFDYKEVMQQDFISLPDQNQGGYPFEIAQSRSDYSWMANQVSRLETSIDEQLAAPGAEAAWLKILPARVSSLHPALLLSGFAVVEGLRAALLAQASDGHIVAMMSLAAAAAIMHLFGVFIQDSTGRWKVVGIQNLKSADRTTWAAFWNGYFSANAIAATSLFAFPLAHAGVGFAFTLLTAIVPHLVINLLSGLRSHTPAVPTTIKTAA